jgi:hypothetical protein
MSRTVLAPERNATTPLKRAKVLPTEGATVPKSGGACRKGENYKQSQISINLYRDTTASRAVERLKNRHRPAPEEHRQECLWYRGRARCFESWMTKRHQTRNSATESIPASRSPFWGNQWAATPKLTMIAGAGNFPSGSSRCESFLFNPTIADEGVESECDKGREMRGRPINRA